MKTLTGKWNYPTTVFFGPGTIAKIRSHNQITPINQRLLVYM